MQIGLLQETYPSDQLFFMNKDRWMEENNGTSQLMAGSQEGTGGVETEWGSCLFMCPKNKLKMEKCVWAFLLSLGLLRIWNKKVNLQLRFVPGMCEVYIVSIGLYVLGYKSS